ncbi:MAG: 50S ribosomal protein L13 [Patescibacteria group bacterium]
MKREIHKIDATDRILGRLATQIAMLLRGKNKASFVPHLDEGDIVHVSNADKIKFSGKKLEQKEYIWHSNHPGGLKRRKVKDVFKSSPKIVLQRAVFGMLPKNKLRDQMIKRLIIK